MTDSSGRGGDYGVIVTEGAKYEIAQTHMSGEEGGLLNEGDVTLIDPDIS
jgi:hypothetical protein